jgi:hypothetical protein
MTSTAPKTFWLASYRYERCGEEKGTSKVFLDIEELSAFLIAAVREYRVERVNGAHQPEYQDFLDSLSVESLLKTGGVVLQMYRDIVCDMDIASSVFTPNGLLAVTVMLLPEIGYKYHDAKATLCGTADSVGLACPSCLIPDSPCLPAETAARMPAADTLEGTICEILEAVQHRPGQPNEIVSKGVILRMLEAVVAAYIRQNLEDCSDLRYSEDLAKSLVGLEDVTDLLNGRCNEYIIWKHLRSVVRLYVQEVNTCRPIAVTDSAKFDSRMEFLGLNVRRTSGSTSSSYYRDLLPEGNVLVMSILTAAAVTVGAFLWSRRLRQ